MSINRHHISASLLTLSLLSISGCEPNTVTLTAENIDQDKLIRKIKQQQIANKDDFDSLQIAFNTERQITISGNADQIEKMITVADTLDAPSNYYLDISNTQPHHISTREQSISILLSPGEQIVLGETVWQNSPWQYYQGIQNSKLLTLMLKHDLTLVVSMSNNHNSHEVFVSGAYQLQENAWTKITGKVQKRSRQNRNVTTISTNNRKELWLRLTEVDSQSPSS